ncbi:MAG: HD domain-containing protein [Deltaproteobacteria bacterium]|nr:MAG: HD domain-containing protein [Deltaproteobacteria bacterium]
MQTPLYNSRLIDTFVKLLADRYPEVDPAPLFDHAGITPWEVADQSHWFTQEQVDRFYLKAVQATGNDYLAREAGRYAARPNTLGVMRQYVLSLLSPRHIFTHMEKTARNFTRSARFTCRVLSDHAVEVTVTPLPGSEERPYQCENRKGFFEAMVMVFNYAAPSIQHVECLFMGGSCCRYVIKWKPNLAGHLLRLRGYAAVTVLPAALALSAVEPRFAAAAIPSALSLVLTLTWLAERGARREVQNSLDNLVISRDLLMEQLDANYNNAQMSNEIGRAVSTPTDIDQVLAQVIQVLEKRLDFDRGLILLVTSDRSRLQMRAGFGYDPDIRRILDQAEFHLDRPESKGVFTEVFKARKPLLIDDFELLRERHSSHSLKIARLLGIRSFICCPIICGGEAIGILAVDNLKSCRQLQQSDMSRLMGIAPVIGIAIRNADLLAVKEKQFRSTLHVLAASIDARDPLTAGHSEKVTEYTVAICEELGLADSDREQIRVAALLHDYGKIGIPDTILKKPGRLTEEEHRLVREHTLKTRSLLERIHFEGNFRDVPEIAGSHHEKFDGSGYPQGLAGDAIPLGARIIAAADFFEAITAKRHYRSPMPFRAATEQLRRHAASHFDPAVVEAFLKVLARQGQEEDGETLRNGRIPCETPVSLRKNGHAIVGRTRDLSEQGLYVGMQDLLDEGLQVQVIFHLPGLHAQPIEAWGRIAWTNDPSRPVKPGFPPGCGIAFTRIESGEELLADWVRNALGSGEDGLRQVLH